MKLFLCFFILSVSNLFAEEFQDSTFNLHVSSFPTHAELYIGERPSSFEIPGSLKTPVTLQIPSDSLWIRLTLFKTEFSDTTLDVSFKQKKGNQYLMIMLSPETNPFLLEKQQDILKKRNQREWGKNLIRTSSIPLIVSGIFAGFSAYYFNQTEQKAKRINNTWIRESSSFEKLVQNHRDDQKKGKSFRNASAVSLGISALLFSTGLYFYF